MGVRIVVLCGLLHGCFSDFRIECGDGLVCPTDRACDAKRNRCVSMEQVTACAGLFDGASCVTVLGTGVCDANVCVEATCGDGYVTGNEACDDGNTTDNDGCSSDCSSSELCGNGVVDANLGENCDCGASELADGCISLNSDTPGSTCKANCILQCGDGLVNAVEDCDTRPTAGGCVGFGFDRGPLTCSSSCANDVSACGEFGPQRVGGPGLPGPVWSHWIAPTGETFLAGGQFLAAQQGSAWTIQQTSSVFATWSAVAGVDASFVIAVGTSGSLLSPSNVLQRWDGSSWLPFVGPPPVSGAEFAPTDLWVGSPTDIVIVGTVKIPDPPNNVIEEVGVFAWDGTVWTRHLVQLGSLTAIVGLGGGDLIAVGDDGLVAFRRAGVWSTTTLAGAPDLRAVFVDQGQAIAVGDAGAIRHYSIASDVWTTDPIPTTASLLAVAGRSASDLYVSSFTSTGPTTSTGELWHYDGRAWFPLEVDAGIGGITTLLRDPQGDIVGQGANFTTYRFAPGGWGVQPVSDQAFFGPSPAFITGSGDTVFATSGFFLYRYRETSGTVEQIRFPGSGAMHALTEDQLYFTSSVGNNTDEIKLYDGQASTTLACTGCPPSTIIGLWAQAPGHLHFIGRDDNLVTRLFVRTPDGTGTIKATSTGSDRFVAVSGAGSVAYALTREGRVWSTQSGDWMEWTQLPLTGVSLWVVPTGEVFAGGDDGVIWRYDGAVWAPLPTETHERITSIHGSSSTDVFATTQTTVQHFDGARWSPVRCAPNGVGVVWTTEKDAYFIELGRFRRLQRPTPW